jgi:hypothetical protein
MRRDCVRNAPGSFRTHFIPGTSGPASQLPNRPPALQQVTGYWFANSARRPPNSNTVVRSPIFPLISGRLRSLRSLGWADEDHDQLTAHPR